MIDLFYIDSFDKEAKLLLDLASTKLRVHPWPPESGPYDRSILRSKRTTTVDYPRLAQDVATQRGSLLSSPESFAITSSALATYEALAAWTPRTVVGGASQRDEAILDQVRSSLTAPVFVRSERESAAKYVGFDGCVIDTFDIATTTKILGNLRANVSGFREIVVKEVRPILGASSRTTEYRALGLGGQLVAFDIADGETIDSDVAEVVRSALAALATVGADGAVLVDVAIDADLLPFVVEWKDLTGGSLKNPSIVLEALAKVS